MADGFRADYYLKLRDFIHNTDRLFVEIAYRSVAIILAARLLSVFCPYLRGVTL